MDKKLNLLITFLAVATGFIFYYTWNNSSGIDRHTNKDMQESNVLNSLANKVSIPKKEIYKTVDTSKDKHPIKVYLTKENEDKRFIEENNISSVPIEEQEKHIAQVYSNLEPATYQDDVQEAEDNFDELDVKSNDIKDKLNEEIEEIKKNN